METALEGAQKMIYSAYVCPICHSIWPHPSFKCSGVGGFNDHPETTLELKYLVESDEAKNKFMQAQESAKCGPGATD